MAERRDYIALEWLSPEIRQSLELATENLALYQQNVTDLVAASRALEQLHQVQGSLRIVEFSDLALLVSELEQTLKELSIGVIPAARIDDVFAALQYLFGVLPDHVADVCHYHSDLPVALIALFNELRAARGQVMLSSTLLFAPDLSPSPALEKKVAVDAQALPELVGKLRRMYQLALNNYLRGEDVEANLGYLEKVCMRAARLCAGQPQHNFWLACSALVGSLLDGGLLASVASNTVLGRLDRELRQLSNGIDIAASTSLFKDVLFYVGLSKSPAEARAEVLARHRIANDIATPVKQAGYLHSQAVPQVCDELNDLANRLQKGETAREVRARSKDLGDVIAVLGTVKSLYSMRAAVDMLQDNLGTGQTQVVVKALQTIAVNLPADIESSMQHASSAVADAGHVEQRRLLAARSEELLSNAQDAVMNFVAEDWQIAALAPIPEQLTSLANSVRALEFTAAAGVLSGCADYIAQHLIDAGERPDWQALDALADALTATDYYLARSIRGGGEDDTGLLAFAQRCMASLVPGASGPDAGDSAPVDFLSPIVDAAQSHSLQPASDATVQEAASPIAGSREGRGETLDVDPEILEIFIEEAGEVLDTLREKLPRWREAILSREILADVRRAFHTLKGSGRMAGAMQCGELGWALENMLNKVVDERFDMDDARLVVVEQAIALLPSILDGLQQNHELPDEQVAPLRESAELLTREQSPDMPSLAAVAESASDEDLIGVFVGEAEVHLAAIEHYLDSVVSYPVRLNDDVQRSLHTLKGSSKMAEVWAIANIITPLESLVKELRALRVPADEELISLIAAVVVESRRLITRLHHSSPASLETSPTLRQRIASATERMLAQGIDRSTGQISAGELQEFLLVYGEHVQRLLDAIAQTGNPSSELFRKHATIMGQFAIRAEEIGSESTAEMAQALQVMFTRTRDPLPGNYTQLVRQALEQLMEELNQIAAEQTAEGDVQLLDRIRDYEAGAQAEPVSEPVVAPAGHSAEPAATGLSLIDEGADPEILEIFMEEAGDLLESLDEAIHGWSEDRHNTGYTDEILRHLHTMKGGARLSGLSALGDLSHDFETLLTVAIVEKRIDSPELMTDVQRYQDKLVRYLDAVAAGDRVLEDNVTAAAASPVAAEPSETEVVAQGEDELPPAPLPAVQYEPEPVSATEPVFRDTADDVLPAAAVSRAPQEMIKVPSALLEQLINTAGETSISRSRVEEQVNDVNFSLEEMEMTVSRLQDQVRRLDIETEAQMMFRQEQMGSEGAEGFDPLEFDRYSQLQQLSRALMESASDLIDLRNTVVDKNRDIETLLAQQARINTELQEGLMRSQMVHFSRMVPRLRRGVRQIASELGKDVNFTVHNAEGEMDRRVLERIIPALEHVLRNAIDHGIESRHDRIAAGKPAQGQIGMRFERQGGDVVIRVKDDGGGVNLLAVRQKAESLGWLTADAEVSDAQLRDYIFHPGFSTASNVTQISGRGVGMDVVRSEIKQLGGNINLDSRAGTGTEFEIRLPFTVSVNRALMVSVAGEVYAVPLNQIEGIVRVSPYELEVYYEPGGPSYEYAGQAYKLCYMGQLIGGGKPLLEGQVEHRPVMLIRNADPPMAVQVDSLLGSREVVVKTLGPQFAAVPGLSGASVLGDGSVVVILDVLASIRASEARLLLHDDAADQRVDPDAELRRVMVVDDSVTVRKVTSRLLERQKMQVMLARDGLDAIQQLQEMEPLPDVMLLDIEMPRMDGFEVASRMRGNPRLQDIPIIMISSRTGQKHRQRAQGLGVERFLGKPYQEIQLLKAIDEVITSTEVV